MSTLPRKKGFEMAHGIKFIDVHWKSGKVLHVQCLCYHIFYPNERSAFETFNEHLALVIDRQRGEDVRKKAGENKNANV